MAPEFRGCADGRGRDVSARERIAAASLPRGPSRPASPSAFNPRLARIMQPVTQVAASVPATALFPVLLLAIVQFGGGLGVGSVVLMLLGTQWYILFNVIAGASAIPSDLTEVAGLFHFSRADRWRIVILPGIFPLPGHRPGDRVGRRMERQHRRRVFSFQGTRSCRPSDSAPRSARRPMPGASTSLLLATIIMATMVVCTNRLVWRPLYRLAGNKIPPRGSLRHVVKIRTPVYDISCPG